MPVTVQTTGHAACEWTKAKVSSDVDLLRESCHGEYAKSKELVQSSFPRSLLREEHISSSRNGLLYACIEAYSTHHHLVLRPEDIWFAILSQIGFYVNGNAEEVRHLFVEHKGQKELEVVDAGSLEYADFGRMAERMTLMIQKNVIDPDLRQWVMPAFSTTTDSDLVVASILMMGAVQKFFSYRMTTCCGIPSVTLLGTVEDWEEIERRIPKLEQLGNEPTEFARLLRPIMHRFIESFRSPGSPVVQEFWGKIAHQHYMSSGDDTLSGWITAFAFWNADGSRLAGKRSRGGCGFDEIFDYRVAIVDIPAGYASVPVTVNDNGNEFQARMVAGSVGITAKGGSLDSIQPVSGWWMFETKDNEEREKPGAKKTKTKCGGAGSSCAIPPYGLESSQSRARNVV